MANNLEIESEFSKEEQELKGLCKNTFLQTSPLGDYIFCTVDKGYEKNELFGKGIFLCHCVTITKDGDDPKLSYDSSKIPAYSCKSK